MNLEQMKEEKKLLESALVMINDSISCSEKIKRLEKEAIETDKNITLTKFVREATVQLLMEFKDMFKDQKVIAERIYNETIWKLALSPKN